MPRTIAVVEDNVDNRLLVRALLEDEYELMEFESGSEALRGIQALRPDLVLLDISLPEMDGTEVLERLRREPDLRELPVVALTAHAMVGDRKRFLDLGFDGYISKPIDDEEPLLRTIARLLGDEAD